MSKAKATRRWFILTLVMLTWLIVGVSTPLVLRFAREGVQTEQSSVVAAPRQTLRLFHPVSLQQPTGLVVRTGVISLEVADGEKLTDQEREKRIRSGLADLELRYGEVSVLELFAWRLRKNSPSYRDRSPSDSNPMGAPLQSALRHNQFRKLSLTDTAVLITLPSGHPLRLTSKSLVLKPQAGEGFTLEGDAIWRGHKISVSIIAGATKKTGNPATDLKAKPNKKNKPHYHAKTPIKFSLRSPLLQFTYDGILLDGTRPALNGKSRFAAEDLSGAVRALGVSLSGFNGIKKLDLTASLTWVGQRLSFTDARIAIDGQDARGGLSLDLSHKRPLLGGTLDFETLDVAQFQFDKDRKHSIGQRIVNSLWRVFDDGGHKRLDMDLRFSADDVRFGRVSLGRSAASLLLSNGVMKAHIAELTIAQGTGTAQLSVDFEAQRPSVTVRGKIKDARLAELTTSLTGKPLLEGTGTVRFDVTAFAGATNGLARSIDGRIEVQLNDGGRAAVNLATLMQPLAKSAASPGDLPSVEITKALLDGRSSAVDKLHLNIALSNGRANCETFSLVAGEVALKGHLHLNLWTHQVSGRAVVRQAKQKGGRADSALAISGTLSKLKVHRSALASDFENEVLAPATGKRRAPSRSQKPAQPASVN